MHRRPALGEKAAIGTTRGVRIEPLVVVYDENPIAGHGEVELECGHPDGQRRGEGRQGVLRSKPARAAMTLQIEGGSGRTRCNGRHGQGHQQRVHD